MNDKVPTVSRRSEMGQPLPETSRTGNAGLIRAHMYANSQTRLPHHTHPAPRDFNEAGLLVPVELSQTQDGGRLVKRLWAGDLRSALNKCQEGFVLPS